MHTLDKPALMFACCLSALAGYVDAIGFIQLGGFFVSFMSGNSTRLAVDLQHGAWETAGMIAAILSCFVAGAAAGFTLNRRARAKLKTISVLILVTILLAAAASCNTLGLAFTAMLIIALAMGAANSALQSGDDNVVGVTYMTGALVKIGQRLAAAFHGEERYSWVPYLMLWLGLITGGILGALLLSFFGPNALWFAAGWAGLLSLLYGMAHR